MSLERHEMNQWLRLLLVAMLSISLMRRRTRQNGMPIKKYTVMLLGLAQAISLLQSELNCKILLSSYSLKNFKYYGDWTVIR
mmetsp:Transcript_18084/g.49925  ORF Transcript_18084/g.49925 Transcript_18084/m.49925 type:complete len:82 (+) Transcript_18084:605-850(+)